MSRYLIILDNDSSGTWLFCGWVTMDLGRVGDNGCSKNMKLVTQKVDARSRV